MADYQDEKCRVRAFHDELTAAPADGVAEVLAKYAAPDWRWRGTHPFGRRTGPAEVGEVFWAPIKSAFRRLQRRPDIFFAGCASEGDESVWVVESGHVMGLFDRTWLTLQPTGRIAMLRYAEFNRIESGLITDTTLFVDIPNLMWQTGQYPLPFPTGAHLVMPGPMTHDGLQYGPQDPATGAATLRAIEALLCNEIARHDPEEATKLSRVWHEDMIWWGPGGIGASYTIERYIAQHCKPFDDGLVHDAGPPRERLCCVAEGNYGGFFGWSNYHLSSIGGYLGMTAGNRSVPMPFVDLYRVIDGKLAENWVFIDILGFLADQGLDVLGRMPATTHRF
jgi:hypothetical protein